MGHYLRQHWYMKTQKNDPKHIWFLTAIVVDESKMLRHSKGDIKVEKFTRTFGYHYGFENALNSVHHNHGNMHECLYNYLVMEQIGEGIHALAESYHWFKWDTNIGWKACDRPKWANGLTNWALG